MTGLEKLPGLLAAGDWAAAEKVLKRAAKGRAPVSVLYNLGRVLMEQGKWGPARIWLHKAVRAAPDHADAWFELGRTALELSDPDAACDSFARAVALAPGDVDARMNWGRLAVRLGRFEQGLEALRPLAGTNGEADAWLYRAAAESGDPATGTYRAALWAAQSGRARAIRTATRVAKGQLPLDL